jgi:putative flippase GtrA
MSLIDHCRREAPLALKFAGVGCLGFVTDALTLRLALAAGLSPAAGRLLSLFLAMQVTFTVNGLLVFRCLNARRLPRQWAGYMGSNGFGNLCNYLIFVGLVASRLPLLSGKFTALTIGSLTAWAINYLGARLIAFGGADLRQRVCADCEAAEGEGSVTAPVLGQLD